MAGNLWRATILISVSVLLLSACAGGAEDEPSQEEDEFTLPPRSEPAASPGKSLGAGSRTVTGVLGVDDIEGGCWFLQDADGTRFEVVYPVGWTLDRTAGELRADDGRVARPGDAIMIRGSLATDRSSVCQIGPILQATEVDLASR